MTGNIDTYLLIKELERDSEDSQQNELEKDLGQLDAH